MILVPLTPRCAWCASATYFPSLRVLVLYTHSCVLPSISTGFTDTNLLLLSSLRYFSLATTFSFAGALRTLAFLVAFLTCS